MSFSKSARKLIAIATGSVMVLGVAVSMSVTTSASANVNLLPNPSFEYGVADVTAQPQYTNSQPMLPAGWAFEGSAGLFDHSQNVRHTGRRSAAISIPASGKRRMCDLQGAGGPCVDNPAQGAKDGARQYFSVNPAWRTLLPVNVSQGQTYTLKSYVAGELVTAGEGAFLGVRWYTGDVPIGYSQYGPVGVTTVWAQIGSTFTAPAGANKAHILLGHSDDTWIGQVRFDDVCFGNPC